ncbi:glycosyltransferase family 39 protein [soil metagenome]
MAVALGVLAVAVSAIGSGTASLWGDEAASLMSAERPLGSLMMMMQHVDAVHALYYLGLHVWIGVAGTSPFALRFPSAVAIGLAVGGLVMLGRQMRGLRYGILAGVLAMMLPRLTDVGSEARSYAFTAAIAVGLSLLLTIQVQSRTPGRRVWVIYGALVALGTLLFLWLALVAVAQLLVLVLVRRDLLRAALTAVGAGVAAASPVLLFAFLERGQIAYLGSRQAFDATSILVAPWFEDATVAIVLWPLVAVGGVLAVREWLLARRGWSVPNPRARVAILPLAWMLVPTVALLAGSAMIAVFTPRYLAMCAPAVALLAAAPLDALLARSLRARRPVAGVVAIVALLAVGASIAPVWSAQRQPYAKNNSDWAAISSELGAVARPGDAVAFDDSVRPSRRTRLALHAYPAGFVGLRDITLKTSFTASSTWYDQTYDVTEASGLGRLDGVRRVWLVEYALPGSVDDAGVAALKLAGFHETSAVRLHRSAVLEFVRG